jgi:hypothetical protein
MDNLTIVLIVLTVFCILRLEWVRHRMRQDAMIVNYNFQQVAAKLALPMKTKEEHDGINNG